MTRWLKRLFGLALLPAAVAGSRTLGAMALRWWPEAQTQPAWYGLALGVSLWTFLAMVRPLPDRWYIWAHELTHALWALGMGGRVRRLKVSRRGGWVELTRSNVWITLAPYFFPFYTWLVFAAYGLVSLVADPAPAMPAWWALLGFTWSFHVTFTVKFLRIRQPDIVEHGRLFSWTLIYLINIAGLSLWIAIVGPPSGRDWLHRSGADLRHAYTVTAQSAHTAVRTAARRLPRVNLPPHETSAEDGG